jgi:hypothetical protein
MCSRCRSLSQMRITIHPPGARDCRHLASRAQTDVGLTYIERFAKTDGADRLGRESETLQCADVPFRIGIPGSFGDFHDLPGDVNADKATAPSSCPEGRPQVSGTASHIKNCRVRLQFREVIHEVMWARFRFDSGITVLPVPYNRLNEGWGVTAKPRHGLSALPLLPARRLRSVRRRSS